MSRMPNLDAELRAAGIDPEGVDLESIVDEICQKCCDFVAKHNREPEVLVMNREHQQALMKLSTFRFYLQTDGDGFPKRVMGMLYSIQNVTEISLR